ncbi:MAG: hypothetical protein Q8L47_02420 [bacterium]|nr:hypothetical protein [bacterium]
MQNIVIPSINCEDFSCIKKRIAFASAFKQENPNPDEGGTGASSFAKATADKWVHIDVSDGKFTPHISWNNPDELTSIMNNESRIKIEVHLMIENPEVYIDAWLRAGAKRIIVHLEVMQDSVLILEKCKKYNAECFLAIKPETEVDRLFAYTDPRTKSPLNQFSDGVVLEKKDFMDMNMASGGALVRGSVPRKEKLLSADSEALHFDGFLILGVTPGPSGQKMDQRIFEKIKKLRNRFQDSIIEVDGGINLETAKLAKEAGANLFVAGAYIFNSKNPKGAYEELSKIVA